MSFSGVDILGKQKADAGLILSDRLCTILHDLNVPNGLKALGYTEDDIPSLVKGTLPQVIISRQFLKI